VNVQGLVTRPAKLRDLYKSLSSPDFSIAVLTESNLSPALLHAPTHSPPQSLRVFTSRDPSQSGGSGVTVVASSSISVTNFTELIPGYLVRFAFKTPFLSSLAFGVYSPPANVPRASSIVSSITRSLQDSQHAHSIVLGDLNATFRAIDRVPSFVSSHDKIWRDFVAHVDLHDTIDRFHPSTPLYTLTTKTSRARLDHVFTSSSLLPSLVSATVRGGVIKQGDHYAVVVSLRVPGPTAFTSTISRTPTQDIYDTPFCVRAQSLLNSLRPAFTSPPSSREAWAHFLASMDALSRFATNYTCSKAGYLRRLVTVLEKRLVSARDSSLPHQRASSYLSESVLNARLAQYEHDLTARKAMLLNKVVGFDANECDYTTRILSSRTLNDVDRCATSLLHPSLGTYAHTTSDMLAASRAFYNDLLGVRSPQPCAPELNSFLPSLLSLSPQQQQKLLAPVTLKEARETIKALKSRKAPGPDGIPNDLFKAFADLLAPHLQPVLESFLREPWLPEVVQGVVIAPLYKGEGDRRDLGNWRPISLVNTTYKLIALFLMRRLNPFMSSLVLPGQTSGVPGRTTFDNVLCARLAQFAADRQEVDVSFAFIDCVKAFDRVEWPYMWATLRAMAVPLPFIACIKALYTDAAASVRVNGFLSNSFLLGRGVRQGCPLSPLLYVLALEPIRHFMNALAVERPLTWLPQGFPSSLAHADDLTFFAWSDLVLTHLSRIQIYASSKLHSGFLVNITKTYVLYLQKESVPSEQTLQRFGALYKCFHWSDDHKKKHLGLAIGGVNTDRQALKTACSRARAKLGVFGPCTLPLLQKARLLVSRYGGTLQYFAQCLSFPSSDAEQLSRDVLRAFWGPFAKHQNFVRTSRIFFPLDLGGAGLLDPPVWFQAFHRTRLLRLAQAVRRPCDSRDHPPVLADPALVLLFKFLVRLLGPEFSFDPATFFWQPRNIRETIASRFPPYWHDVLRYFEHDIASEHNIGNAVAESRPEFQDIPYALFSFKVPFPGASAIDLADLENSASVSLRGGLPWAGLIKDPAYMVPFAIDPGPRRCTPRRRTSGKSSGGPVSFHYKAIQLSRLNANPWDFSAENDWIGQFPALQGDPNSADVDGGRVGMPPGEKDRLGKMLRLCRGKRYGYVLSHAWLLFQGRLDAPYHPCPWCHSSAITKLSHFERFLHVSWCCNVFQRHWARLRSRAQVRSITFISDLALGLAPDGSVRLSTAARKKGLALHAAIWRRLCGGPSRVLSYDDVLGYYAHLLAKPEFFEEEFDPHVPPYLTDPT
jgi:Reverse transcriptase (RNA-dependent DNA polymerase)